jgi:hypothetical protein
MVNDDCNDQMFEYLLSISPTNSVRIVKKVIINSVVYTNLSTNSNKRDSGCRQSLKAIERIQAVDEVMRM